MKRKTLFTLVLLVACVAVDGLAQQVSKFAFLRNDTCFVRRCVTRECPCTDKHPVYNIPVNKKPKNLPRLGTNPQFGTLKYLKTEQEVYDHLHKRYDQNRGGDAAELDKLFNAMGYNGFKDASFTVSQLTGVLLYSGVTGMLGAGGHTYEYTTIAPGKDIYHKAYRVTSSTGCDIYIMETCGNAFFTGCENLTDCETVACGTAVGEGSCHDVNVKVDGSASIPNNCETTETLQVCVYANDPAKKVCLDGIDVTITHPCGGKAEVSTSSNKSMCQDGTVNVDAPINIIPDASKNAFIKDKTYNVQVSAAKFQAIQAIFTK